MIATSDPSAELMELRESESVGFLDDDDGGIRDIDADLDDGGRDQDIEGSFLKGFHHGFLFLGFHFSMYESDPEVREDLLFERFVFRDGGFDILEGERRFHEWEDDEGLTAFFDFLPDEILDLRSIGVVTGDLGDDRFAVFRHLV